MSAPTIIFIVIIILTLIVFMFVSAKIRTRKIEENTAKLEQKGFNPTSGVTFEPYRFLVDKNSKQWCVTDLVSKESDFKLFDFSVVKDAVFLEDEETVLKASEIEYPIFESDRKDVALKLQNRNELYEEGNQPQLEKEQPSAVEATAPFNDDKEAQVETLATEEKEVLKELQETTEATEPQETTKEEAIVPKNKHDFENYQKALAQKKADELLKDPSYKTNPFKTPVPKEGSVEEMKIKVLLEVDGKERSMTIQLIDKKIKRNQSLYGELYRGTFKIVNQFAYIIKKNQG